MAKFIYTRISTATSEVDNQVNLIQQKWGPGLTVIEELKSGTKKRPKLMHLLTNIMKPGDTLYVAHSDRLTRSGIGDFFAIIALARARDIQIVSLHQGELVKEDPDPMHEMLEAMGATIAKMEAQATSRRIKDMFERRRMEGKLSGVYLAIANGNHRHAHKELNPVIVKATPRMKQLRKKGMPYREIVEVIEREFGHKTSASHVHRIVNG